MKIAQDENHALLSEAAHLLEDASKLLALTYFNCRDKQDNAGARAINDFAELIREGRDKLNKYGKTKWPANNGISE